MSSTHGKFALLFFSQTHFNIRYTEVLEHLLLGDKQPWWSN